MNKFQCQGSSGVLHRFLCSTSKILGKSQILWLQSGFLKLANPFSCCREVGSKFVAPNLKKISKTEENVPNKRLGRAGVLYISKMFKSSLEWALCFVNPHQTAVKEQQCCDNTPLPAHSLLILEHFGTSAISKTV